MEVHVEYRKTLGSANLWGSEFNKFLIKLRVVKYIALLKVYSKSIVSLLFITIFL